jgi:hypothetical protein
MPQGLLQTVGERPDNLCLRPPIEAGSQKEGKRVRPHQFTGFWFQTWNEQGFTLVAWYLFPKIK